MNWYEWMFVCVWIAISSQTVSLFFLLRIVKLQRGMLSRHLEKEHGFHLDLKGMIVTSDRPKQEPWYKALQDYKNSLIFEERSKPN